RQPQLPMTLAREERGPGTLSGTLRTVAVQLAADGSGAAAALRTRHLDDSDGATTMTRSPFEIAGSWPCQWVGGRHGSTCSRSCHRQPLRPQDGPRTN